MADRDEKDDDKVKPRRVVAFAFGWWLAAGVTVAVAASGVVFVAQRRNTGSVERRGPTDEVPRADTTARRAVGPPPQVDERRGWARSGSYRSWIRGGSGSPRAFVLRRGSTGSTEMWADTAGIFFRDPVTGTINTIIDMTEHHMQFGPGIEYQVIPDTTASYFVIRAREGRWLLIDQHGTVLWRYQEGIGDTFIVTVYPSSRGDLLVWVSDVPEDHWGWGEIWRFGSIIARLPRTMEDDWKWWSDDGERIYYKWRPPPFPHSDAPLRSAVFDCNGRWLEGNEP